MPSLSVSINVSASTTSSTLASNSVSRVSICVSNGVSISAVNAVSPNPNCVSVTMPGSSASPSVWKSISKPSNVSASNASLPPGAARAVWPAADTVVVAAAVVRAAAPPAALCTAVATRPPDERLPSSGLEEAFGAAARDASPVPPFCAPSLLVSASPFVAVSLSEAVVP